MHAKSCPHCGKSAKADFAPFCCKRCQQVDLHRWFTGAYAVASDKMPDDEEDGEGHA